jgi:hypothetical protein
MQVLTNLVEVMADELGCRIFQVLRFELVREKYYDFNGKGEKVPNYTLNFN